MSKKSKKEETKEVIKEFEDIKYYAIDGFPEEGVRFIDLTPSIIDVRSRMMILSKMTNHIENEIRDIDVIISPDARGFIWGMGVATLMNVQFVPVRKAGKLPSTCTSATVKYDTEYSNTALDLPLVDLKDKRVMFVDDVYATGGTYEACKKLVELAGGKLVNGTVIYDVGLNKSSEIFSLTRGNL